MLASDGPRPIPRHLRRDGCTCAYNCDCTCSKPNSGGEGESSSLPTNDLAPPPSFSKDSPGVVAGAAAATASPALPPGAVALICPESLQPSLPAPSFAVPPPSLTAGPVPVPPSHLLTPCDCCDPRVCPIYASGSYLPEVTMSGCRLCALQATETFSAVNQLPSTTAAAVAAAAVAASGPPPTLVSNSPDYSNTVNFMSRPESSECLPPSLEPRSTTPPAQTYDGPFSNPVYKKLSRINGEINKMSYSQLKERLTQLGIDNRGFKDVLKKRLKTFYKKQSLVAARIPPQPKTQSQRNQEAEFLVVIDFEATCEEKNYPEFPHEIIEFPAVVVDARAMEIVDTFHSYVRPKLKPILTKFCSTLTGIRQETVENAPPFEEVLQSFLVWLEEREYFKKYRCTVVTDGPWDMCRFMVSQCKLSRIKIPFFARKWCNVRKVFGNFYGTRRLRLTEMLFHLGLNFEGKPHSGLDDAKNIATVALRLVKDGASLSANEKLQKVIIQKVKNDSLGVADDSDSDEAVDEEEEEEHKENLAWALQMMELKDAELYNEDEDVGPPCGLDRKGRPKKAGPVVKPLMEL